MKYNMIVGIKKYIKYLAIKRSILSLSQYFFTFNTIRDDKISFLPVRRKAQARSLKPPDIITIILTVSSPLFRINRQSPTVFTLILLLSSPGINAFYTDPFETKLLQILAITFWTIHRLFS